MNALVKNQGRSIGFIALFVCMHLIAGAQIKASFTATPVTGCSPLVVYFTDESTGPATSWRWELGNGVVSTLKNPSATYFNPGTYTVKLVVRNASGADSLVKQQYITIYGNPTVDFVTTDTIGCAPKPVLFTDKSIAGSGTLSKWEWDFGDGSIASGQQPSHVYASSGSFNVSLKLTNSFGCTKTVTKTQYIKINEGVKASFNTNSKGLCAAPASVQFNNTSASPAVDFAWDFGDGSTSSANNPSHTYSSNGSYSVSLIAVSAQGCRDTLKKENFLNIGVNRSAFSIPALVCAGEQVFFNNTTVPLPVTARWDFGNGSFSDSIHASTTYNTAGNYTIKLVNDFGECRDSISKSITVVSRPKADFNAGSKLFCKAPANVQFQSQAANAVSYFWSFGDGTSSIAANPIHTYNAFGKFSVTLVVTNAAGCTDTVTKKDFVQVQKPQIEFKNLPQSGCVPLTVNPSAKIISNQTILSYLWKFGDGTTSTAASPQHIYNTAGTYSVTLVITTQSGCKDSLTLSNAVRAGNKPHAQFIASPGETCNANPVTFTDESTGNVDEWHWSFGDHHSSGFQNPSHVFDGIGKFDVTLVAVSNGCADTVTVKDAVNVLPPLSIFSVQHSCTNKYKFDFIDESVGATSIEWDFGDGSSSTSRNASHTYAKPGVYKVGMKTFNSTCSNYNYTFVKVVDEKAGIVLDKKIICKGGAVNFSASPVIDSNIVDWRWDIDDGIYTGKSFSHAYTTTGTYRVVLTLTDVNGCKSSDTTELQVFGPRADFNISSPSACLKENSIDFTNLSATDGTHNIVKSTWNFGDGQYDSTGAIKVQHKYQNTGTYTISMLVKDSYGCTDEMIKKASLVIAQPIAGFYSADTMSCLQKNISFIDTSKGAGITYQWSFGDGISSSKQNPVHIYNNIGVYTVKLLVTDKYGCKDSATKNDYVNISIPKAKFTVSDSIGNCPPLIVTFTNASTDFISCKWEFGDGNQSTLTNPVHYYNTAGTFYARLTVTGPGGCTDVAVQKIVVKGPSGTLSYTPLSGCNPLTVNFSAKTQNTTSFVWDFSDGNTLFGNNNSTIHEYTSAGDFIPKIILTDAAGCTVPIVGDDTVRVYQVTAAFEASVHRLCKEGYVQFTNKTISNDLISSYTWDFGDGTTATSANPLHFYKQAGIYSVQLTAFTQNGCSNTIILKDTITILPSPSVSIQGGNEVCAGTSIGFNATVNPGSEPVIIWEWDLGNGKKFNTQTVPYQNYTVAGSYPVTLIAIAANNCSDTAIKNLAVHPLPTVYAGQDEWVCYGSKTQLQASGADKYEWNAPASLSCTNCQNPFAAPSTHTKYVVTGYNQFGCSNQDTVLLSVQQPFHLSVGTGDTICLGKQVKLIATGADLYNWYPATEVQRPNEPTTLATPPVTTAYHVVGKDVHNCFTDTAEVFIKVWPIPTVSAGADQTLAVGSSLQLKTTTSQDVSAWQWIGTGAMSCTTCATTLVKPKQTTVYRVIVKNDGGCSASDDVTVNVICNNGNLFVPNTFSPNGDGMNDRFFPGGTGINRIKSLRVFNRWGEVVFEKTDFSANDASMGWDGKYKGQPLGPDVYIWSCEVICENNEILTFKGDVTLLR